MAVSSSSGRWIWWVLIVLITAWTLNAIGVWAGWIIPSDTRFSVAGDQMQANAIENGYWILKTHEKRGMRTVWSKSAGCHAAVDESGRIVEYARQNTLLGGYGEKP